MSLRDCLGKCHAEPTSGRIAVSNVLSGAAKEAIEHPFALCRRDPGSIVKNAQNRLSGFRRRVDIDTAARRRVVERVVHVVQQDVQFFCVPITLPVRTPPHQGRSA